MHSCAPRHAPGDLRNDRSRKPQPGMTRAELNQGLCHLLRCGDTNIRDETTMQSLWLIEIDHVFNKICTVPGYREEVRPVPGRVVSKYQSLILFGSGLNLETVDRPVVGRAHKFIPVSTRSLSVRQVGSDAL